MTGVTDAVAIVGMACRFPGGVTSPASFWDLLHGGRDAIQPISREGLERFYDARPRTPGRMVTRWGGFLDDIERFDAAFFGISPREAMSIDPSQRLLIEAAWEAFEDAAIDPHALVECPAGVYVGQWVGDFETRVFGSPDELDMYGTTGSGRYATSGRLSYVFGLTGPSMTIDTACSASLVAVHLACQSLRSGESPLAIAAGVNVILEPHVTIAYSQGGVMAPDGRCKFGDASADGYVRSEGAAVVVLKRLADALADGDPIRAVIRGSAVNNDGRTNGHLTTPSRIGQAAMLRTAFADAGVTPHEVGYIEAHGTGTKVGDPIELGALADVFGTRPASERCLVGSVKSNIGHTEGAAGLAGLLKCVLALQHEEVPPSLHLHHPNPTIPWDELPFEIPRQPRPWPRTEVPRVAGVSAYGITGTNAHVVLEEAPLPGRAITGATEPVALPLALSAATPPALRDLAASYAARLRSPESPPLLDVCATAARHRAALEHRTVFVASDAATMADALERFAAGDEQAAATGRIVDATARRVAFAFPGQGGQWEGMGRELLAREPCFAAAIDRCDAALPDGLGWTVRQQLTVEPGHPSHRLGEIAVLQPTLLAVEIALAELWQSWGVRPAAVVGHSMGEVAAAHIAGALDLADAMAVICARSALMQRTSGAGAMALVAVGADEAQRRIEPFAGRVCVAVMNGPRSSIVSGDVDAVAEVLAGCERDGVFARAVQVDVASHSPHMDPLVPELMRAVGAVAAQPTAFDLYSTVDADLRAGETWDAPYWGRNLRETVQFGPTVARMLAAGVDTVIEVGPHPTLLLGIEKPAAGDRVPLLVGSLRRHEPEREAMLSSLGAIWAAGGTVDWSAQFPAGSYAIVDLPLYPWQRERHWSPAALPAPPGGGRRRRLIDATAQQWLHVLQWEAAPVATASGPASWIVVGDGPDVHAVDLALQERGGEVRVVPSTDAAARALADEAPADLTGIVVLTEPDTPAFAVVATVQQLGAYAPARLWWITRGAHVVAGEEPSAHAAEQAAVWGAARVVATEHPDRWGGLVDLDPRRPLAGQAGLLADHLGAARDEDQVALRDGERHALRLVPADAPAPRATAWRTDAAYLLTGGFGGIAQRVARAMVADGARRLVLLTRTPLPPRADWASLPAGSELDQRARFVRELEHAGAAVHIVQADVADEAQVRRTLDAYAAEGWPPIAGVIHTAAAVESGLTNDLDRATFERVLAPKLTGALVLDRLLPELDLFVVFSSISAFWAPEGMANYAAANAGIDSLVGARRARGQHAVSIQWGPWSRVGLHDHTIDERTVDRLAADGIGTVTEDQALAYFDALTFGDHAVAAVVPIDWTAFHHTRGGWESPLFRRAPAAGDGAVAGASIVATLREASPRERSALLQTLVRDVLAGVLRQAAAQLDPSRPFGLLGLDSLMALELRNRLQTALGRPLSATLAWNYPTVVGLAGHLETLLVDASPAITATVPATEATSAGTTDVDVDLALFLGELATLSDDEAAQALRDAR